MNAAEISPIKAKRAFRHAWGSIGIRGELALRLLPATLQPRAQHSTCNAHASRHTAAYRYTAHLQQATNTRLPCFSPLDYQSSESILYFPLHQSDTPHSARVRARSLRRNLERAVPNASRCARTHIHTPYIRIQPPTPHHITVPKH